MSLFIKLEYFLLGYENSITVFFTLALIIAGISTTLISFRSLKLQRRIFLKKTFIDLKKYLCEYQIKREDLTDERKSIVDKNITEISFMIDVIKKIDNKGKEFF